MKTLITFSILIGVTIFFSCSQEKKPITESNSNEAKVVSLDTVPKTEIKKNAVGEKIFNDNCITCHGIDGKKKHSGAKDLSISTLSIEECIKVISSAQTIGGRLHAPRFPAELSDDEIKDVAQYIVTLRK